MLCLLQDELLASRRWDFPWDDLGAAAVSCPEQTGWVQGNLESGNEITSAPAPHGGINTSWESDCFLSLCQVLGAHRVVISFLTATPQPGPD